MDDMELAEFILLYNLSDLVNKAFSHIAAVIDFLILVLRFPTLILTGLLVVEAAARRYGYAYLVPLPQPSLSEVILLSLAVVLICLLRIMAALHLAYVANAFVKADKDGRSAELPDNSRSAAQDDLNVDEPNKTKGSNNEEEPGVAGEVIKVREIAKMDNVAEVDMTSETVIVSMPRPSPRNIVPRQKDTPTKPRSEGPPLERTMTKEPSDTPDRRPMRPSLDSYMLPEETEEAYLARIPLSFQERRNIRREMHSPGPNVAAKRFRPASKLPLASKCHTS